MEELWTWLPQKLFSLPYQCHTDDFSPLRLWDLKLAQGSTTQCRCSHFQQRVAISCIWFGRRAKKERRREQKRVSYHSCTHRLTFLGLTQGSDQDAWVHHLEMVFSKIPIIPLPRLQKKEERRRQRPTFMDQSAQELFWQISWWLDLLFCNIIHGDKHEDFLFSLHKWGNCQIIHPPYSLPKNKA